MFGNKHVTTALIVAPILAILAYFLVDQLVSEKAQPAVAYNAYTLLVKPNCRHASGQCSLVNGEVEIKLTVDHTNITSLLLLESNFALTGARLGLNGKSAPQAMLPSNTEKTHWHFTLPENISSSDTVRLALQIQKSYYYTEITLPFMHYETSFSLSK